MVLGDDNPAARLSRLAEDRLAVQRLDGISIDDPQADVLPLELVMGFESFEHGDAGSDDGSRVSVPTAEDLGASDGKLLFPRIEQRRRRPRGPDIGKPLRATGGLDTA